MKHGKATFTHFVPCLVIGVLLAFPANAAYVTTYGDNDGEDKNDCSGAFGQGFENCKIPAKHDPNQSPVIIKFNFKDDGSFGEIEINSDLFPTIDGNEFSFNFNGGAPGSDGNTGTGTWTYTPGAGDPAVNWFVAKGGNVGFNLFNMVGESDTVGVEYYTPKNTNGNIPGISHLTFYDTKSVVPLPAAAWLLLSGLGTLGAMARRRRT